MKVKTCVTGKLLRNVWVHERIGKDGRSLYGGSYYGGNGGMVEVDSVNAESRECLVRVQLDLARSGWAWVGETYLKLAGDATFDSLVEAA